MQGPIDPHSSRSQRLMNPPPHPLHCRQEASWHCVEEDCPLEEDCEEEDPELGDDDAEEEDPVQVAPGVAQALSPEPETRMQVEFWHSV